MGIPHIIFDPYKHRPKPWDWHPKWRWIMYWLDHEIPDRFGRQVFDNRCNKIWDIGQALCAAAYGPEWIKHPIYILSKDISPYNSPEGNYWNAAKLMALGDFDDLPKWLQDHIMDLQNEI